MIRIRTGHMPLMEGIRLTSWQEENLPPSTSFFVGLTVERQHFMGQIFQTMGQLGSRYMYVWVVTSWPWLFAVYRGLHVCINEYTIYIDICTTKFCRIYRVCFIICYYKDHVWIHIHQPVQWSAIRVLNVACICIYAIYTVHIFNWFTGYLLSSIMRVISKYTCSIGICYLYPLCCMFSVFFSFPHILLYNCKNMYVYIYICVHPHLPVYTDG